MNTGWTVRGVAESCAGEDRLDGLDAG